MARRYAATSCTVSSACVRPALHIRRMRRHPIAAAATRPPWSPAHGRAAHPDRRRRAAACSPREAAARLLRTMPPPLLVHAPATLRRLGLRRGAGARPAGAVRLRAAGPPGARRRRAAWPWRSTCRRRTRPGGRGGAAAGHRRRAAARGWPPGRDTAAQPRRRRAGGAHGPGRLGLGAVRAGRPRRRRPRALPSEALRVWKRLPEWEDAAPPPPPRSLPVARGRGARAAGRDARAATPSSGPGQADYAGAAAAAFAPRDGRGDPHLVLAEAGTGTGKTLGYIAPASLWAERNHGAVWISTFTRHLQRQIDARAGAGCFPTRPSAAAAWWCARGARTTCAC